MIYNTQFLFFFIFLFILRKIAYKKSGSNIND